MLRPYTRMQNQLSKLQNQITKCKKCPRLVKYLNEIKNKYPLYWCKPVPSFGNQNAEILILGLAPGRFGSNRTGRMFTGDSSGNFMYKVLHETGLCNQPNATDINDGLILKNCYITAMGRCAPPQNKPTPQELRYCFSFFEEEISYLKNLKVVVTLGKVAFDGYMKWLLNYSKLNTQHFNLQKKDFKFFHGAIYKSKELPHVLIASYHPSRQNTQTGKLTERMFKRIFIAAKKDL